MFETLLIKAIRGFLSYFSNPVSEFPLTYHSELIDEDSASEGKSDLPTAAVLYKAQTLLHSPPHDITHPLRLELGRARDPLIETGFSTFMSYGHILP